MKNIYKIFTILLSAFIALVLTRMGIGYLFILVALGLILPFITKDRISAILSGTLYAAVGYILSYPSGLFLTNYMPSIEIPINVSPIEVLLNMSLGLIIPVIIAIVICFIASLIGKYLSNLITHEEVKDEEKIYFAQEETPEEEYVEDEEVIYPENNNKNKLLNLSHIQKSKNKRKKLDKEW
ncbi:MAG: hypothetical protein BZ138_02425 [Methanosphaera sp. rholeuAM270]|nr:MAG: hypothetical protein BZ138_02425 [Methanosphaera sp. rholeuAM270]